MIKCILRKVLDKIYNIFIYDINVKGLLRDWIFMVITASQVL